MVILIKWNEQNLVLKQNIGSCKGFDCNDVKNLSSTKWCHWNDCIYIYIYIDKNVFKTTRYIYIYNLVACCVYLTPMISIYRLYTWAKIEYVEYMRFCISKAYHLMVFWFMLINNNNNTWIIRDSLTVWIYWYNLQMGLWTPNISCLKAYFS